MEGSKRGLGNSGHYFGYEWYENKGRLHRGQQKMNELCTRLSIKANEETAKEVLPKRKKDRKTKALDYSRMVKVREEYLQIASDRYYRSPTENHREEMERYKSKLHEQYNITIEEDLDKMIRQVETADEESRHKENCRLIDEITGRKTAKKGIVKAKDKNDRINEWYTHFKELLRTENYREISPS